METSNLVAEQNFLGSILIDGTLMETAELQPQAFSEPAHQLIYEAMQSVTSKSMHVDVTTITHELRGELGNPESLLADVGGMGYIVQLARSVPSTAGFNSYHKIIRDMWVMRHSRGMVRVAYTKDYEEPNSFFDEMREALDEAEAATGGSVSGGFRRSKQIAMDHFDLTERINDGETMAYKHRFVIEDLNRLTGQVERQKLVIVGARPSVGKTAFALGNAFGNAKDGDVVAFFSLEQKERDIVNRIISARGNIDHSIVRTSAYSGEEEWSKYVMAISEITDLDFLIDDEPGQSIQDIKRKVRDLRREFPERNIIIYIDYLQLISGGERFAKALNRNEEISFISRELKELARKQDCTVVALSQLSRGVEQRQDKRPMMSDLRESGSIEQDGDLIMFLYRDDYYNSETEKKNIIEVIVAKNRDGNVGTVEAIFLKNYMKFVNYERMQQDMYAG